MDAPVKSIPDLELALLRRGVDERIAISERCERCHRTPLIGERVYQYGANLVLCELCRWRSGEQPTGSRLVHGPEFGHTMKLVDQRAA